MSHESLALVDWRRRVAALYAQIRAADDPVAAHHLWATGREALIGEHPASPLSADERAGFHGLDIAPYDPAFRFVVAVEPPDEARTLEVPTATDGIVPFALVGNVTLPGLGTLGVWALRTYGGGLFVPLRDTTAGRSSYGGGRYVLDTAKGADLGSDDDRLVVDLNFAYNPSCAYDDAWVCPLAPRQNVLAAAAPVGERSYLR